MTLREILNLKYLRGGGDPGAQANHNTAARQPNTSRTISAPQSRTESRAPRAESDRTAKVNVSMARSMQPSATVQNNIVCNCGQDALLLTVRKEGPNQGRQFYKCNTGNCNYFLWADQPNDQPDHSGNRGPTGYSSLPPRPSFGFGNTPQQKPTNQGSGGAGDENMCNCNEPAVTRTVLKDGPNKGRMFLTCTKPRDQQCGFFQWMDENVAPGKYLELLLCIPHTNIAFHIVVEL